MIGRALRLLCALLLAGVALPGPSAAVEPNEMLADPALEARARALSVGLRCLVCQNQNIDDSHAELARDLRLVLRERIAGGDTDDEAVAYLVKRYGNYILLKPPFMPSTVVLWAGPGLLLLIAVAGFGALWRRNGTPPPPAEDLTDADRALIVEALNSKEIR